MRDDDLEDVLRTLVPRPATPALAARVRAIARGGGLKAIAWPVALTTVAAAACVVLAVRVPHASRQHVPYAFVSGEVASLWACAQRGPEAFDDELDRLCARRPPAKREPLPEESP